MLRKIRISTGCTTTTRYEITIHESYIGNPEIILMIPCDLSRLSSISYSLIITISDDE
jgi:hypothetical protein